MRGSPIRLAGLLTGCAAALLVGCDETAIEGIDPFPIAVDTSAGALQLKARFDDGEVVPVVLDTLTPITVIDSHVLGEVPSEPSRRRTSITLIAGTGDEVERAVFLDTIAIDVHPCGDPDAACALGLAGATAEFRGLIGGTLLGDTALRIDVPSRSLRFFPDIAGDEGAHGESCEVVLSSPFAGGGTLAIGGGEVGYSGRRIAIAACVDADAGNLEESTGTDLQLLLTTATGPTLLSDSAFARYQRQSGDQQITTPATLHLPSGPIAVRLGTLPRVALIGDGSEERGPCEELRAGRIMVDGDCPAEITDCPCPDGARFCRTAGAMELQGTISIAIVADDYPLLQALRAELRPRHPEVDGLLGLDAVAALRIDIDYPNDRVLLGCRDVDRCRPRPAIQLRSALAAIAACAGLRIPPLAAPGAP